MTVERPLSTAPVTKVVSWIKETPWRELARFTLETDGTVTAKYSDENLRAEHAEIGIRSLERRRVYPSDGRIFFDSLEVAFANTTFVAVETLDLDE